MSKGDSIIHKSYRDASADDIGAFPIHQKRMRSLQCSDGPRQALKFQPRSDSDPSGAFHRTNFWASMRKCCPCVYGRQREHLDEIDLTTLPQGNDTQLQRSVHFGDQFEQQRTYYLSIISKMLNDDNRITGRRSPIEVARDIEKIVEWAEKNSIRLNEPSADYKQAKQNFEKQAKIVYDTGTAFYSNLSFRTSQINIFNGTVTPLLTQLQTRLGSGLYGKDDPSQGKSMNPDQNRNAVEPSDLSDHPQGWTIE